MRKMTPDQFKPKLEKLREQHRLLFELYYDICDADIDFSDEERFVVAGEIDRLEHDIESLRRLVCRDPA